MTWVESIKPFWPILFTFILPRAINYYRVVRVAIRTRPEPQPLPQKTSQGLNALFASICVFFYASLLPLRSALEDRNIFIVTQSRLAFATDALFSRLAMLREHGILTSTDEALRAKLTSPALRQLYLRFGPSTLINCTFCHPEDHLSYLLYHLPSNVLLPHLFHTLCLGLATSETISGPEASRWRSQALLGGLGLALIDVATTATYTPLVPISTTSPTGLFWLARTLRPLTLCIFDAGLAFLIYASTTRQYLFFLFAAPLPSPSVSAEVTRRGTETLLAQTTLSLQLAQERLRAYTIARNAVVRNPDLKAVDDTYWRAVVAMEGPVGEGSVFDDELVQAAVSRVYGSGSFDAAGVRRDAEAFVRNVAKGLDARDAR